MAGGGIGTHLQQAGSRTEPGAVDAGDLDQPAAWPDSLRRVWLWPEKLTIDAWAEKHRFLARGQTAKEYAGPYRVSVTPFARWVMRLCDYPGIHTVTIRKCSRAGISTAVQNVIGYFAEREPDPLLLVLPDKETGKKNLRQNILPLLTQTPVLRDLSTGKKWDQKNSELRLANGFWLRLGISGSMSSVAAEGARVCINDERSKFQGDDKLIAASIEARTGWFEDWLVVNISSPGPEPDPITELFDAAAIKLLPHCPCPHCGTYQVFVYDSLAWSPDVKEEPDARRRAARVIADKSAWFRCSNLQCAADHPEGHGRIYDHHRREVVHRGYWAPKDQSWKLWNDGREEGTKPLGTHVAFDYGGFVSLAPRHGTHNIASRLILAEGDPAATAGVFNEDLGQTYQIAVGKKVEANDFAKKCLPAKDGTFVPPTANELPLWVTRILMTVDTQIDHFWYVIRAWGHGYRSRRLLHGRVMSFEELARFFDTLQWPYEKDAFPPLGIHMLGIDARGGIRRTDDFGFPRSRTEDVHQWCLNRPMFFKPMMGEGRKDSDNPWRMKPVVHTPLDRRRDPWTILELFFNALHFEDLLASYIVQKIPLIDFTTGQVLDPKGQDLWELNDQNDDEYNRHLSNVEKRLVAANSSSRRKVLRYVPKTAGARHDLRDCEIEQVVLAHTLANIRLSPSPADRAAAMAQRNQPQVSGGVKMPDGRPWIPRK